MTNLRQVSIAFMKRSKILTLSCMVCVFSAVLLINSMWNFSLNATTSYDRTLKAAYGDCDMLVTYEDHGDISQDIITKIAAVNDISGVASGRFVSRIAVEENDVYALGVADSDMIKSRYHYTVELKEDEIVINDILAGCINKTVGDTISFQNIKLTISEVVEDKSYSAGSLAEAIMTQQTLARVARVPNLANFLMVKAKGIAPLLTVIDQIRSIDSSFDIMAVEADTLYKDNVESFAIFVKVLVVIVLLVAAMFVTSIFHSFLYKYNHDMAVIRAMGGTAEQVKSIFMFLSITINGISCGAGFLTSILLNKFVLQALNKELDLIEGKIEFYVFQSLLITIFIYGVILLLLLISLVKNLKILPIEAITKNEVQKCGKQKKRSNSSVHIPYRRIFGKEIFMGVKLILPKMKENLFLTLTIMMIVLLALVGGSLNSLISNNNSNYLKSQYITDVVVTSSNIIDYDNTIKIYERIQEVEGVKASLLFHRGEETEIILGDGNTKAINCCLADLTAMQQQNILTNSNRQKNSIVMSLELAQELSLSVGDSVKISEPKRYVYQENGFRTEILQDRIKQEFVIGDILPMNKMYYNEVYIDIQNTEFIEDYTTMNQIFISGDLEAAENRLDRIKLEYSSIKWSNYQEVMKISTKAIKERFRMFELVIGALITIAGIGWFNSMRSIIYSRTREYSILRVQGISVRSLQAIIAVQVLTYLFTGVILGFGIGTMCLTLLTYFDKHTIEVTFNLLTIGKIVVFMLGVCICLLPTVRKVSMHKLKM